jgi:LemA protein
MLESALSKLLIIQERYPQLKANRNFIDLQRSIGYVERELVHERKVYNKRVSWYNGTIQLFPKNIVAKIFEFEEKPFFSMDKEE